MLTCCQSCKTLDENAWRFMGEKVRGADELIVTYKVTCEDSILRKAVLADYLLYTTALDDEEATKLGAIPGFVQDCIKLARSRGNLEIFDEGAHTIHGH
jgi:hypothetical protein